MKNISFLITLVSIAFFTSCFGPSGIDITKPGVGKEIRKKIEKALPADTKIVEIKLNGKEFSNVKDLAYVYYFENNDSELKAKAIFFDGSSMKNFSGSDVSKRGHEITVENTIKLSDIDFDMIHKNLEKAMSFVKENELPISGTGNYMLLLDSDKDKIIHKFSIESKAGSETKMKGGKFETETSYYDLQFIANSEGEIEYIE